MCLINTNLSFKNKFQLEPCGECIDPQAAEIFDYYSYSFSDYTVAPFDEPKFSDSIYGRLRRAASKVRRFLQHFGN